MTREIRLNNPGGIKRDRQAWQGESTMQDDPVFVRFDTPEYGLRALMKILMAYERKHDLHTVDGIIARWAPPEENDTPAYIRDVCQHLGVNHDAPLELTNIVMLVKLTKAIVVHENGHPPQGIPDFWYGDSVYQEAARLALS